MRTAVAQAARALLAVTVVALVADALLGALTGALGRLGGGPAVPWWVAGNVLERSRWVVFALLASALARAAGPGELRDVAIPAGVAWRFVGWLAIAVPLAWIVAQWIVQAALFTAADRWDVDGLVFLSADYYRRLFVGYVPWLLGGAAALAASRHVS
jgi:hypothetical protein